MAESVTVSQWKMVLTTIFGLLGIINIGYQMAQGDQGLLQIFLLMAFAFISAFGVWTIFSGNTT
jgi:hypothetical protein